VLEAAMELEKRITFHPEVCGGRPCIRGMRIRVSQLPPQLASWLKQRFSVEAHSLRDLGLRDETDRSISCGMAGLWLR
jgi:hypothetical protein